MDKFNLTPDFFSIKLEDLPKNQFFAVTRRLAPFLKITKRFTKQRLLICEKHRFNGFYQVHFPK